MTQRLRGAVERLPWTADAVLLAVILAGFVLLVGPVGTVSVDEGAAAHQARHLADGEGWWFDAPLPAIPDDVLRFPITKSDVSSEGWAPFLKHPAYAGLLAVADGIAGPAGMVALSVAGTVGAAAVAGVLAELLWGAPARRTAIWIAALATPLLFDSYLIIAHTLGAALAGLALVAALRLDCTTRPWPWTALAAAATMAAVLLRTEAILFAAAAALVLLLVDKAWRSWRGFLAPGALLAGVALAVGSERTMRAWVLGDARVITPEPSTTGGFSDWFDDRFEAAWITLLRPGEGGTSGLDLALMAGGALLVLAAATAGRPGVRRGVSSGLAVCGAALVMLRVVAGTARPVSGLLLVLPSVLVGLVRWRAAGLRSARSGTARTLGWTVALFAVAVVLTQYRQGGGFEWGGRYFALGLPVLAAGAAGPLAEPDRRPTWRPVLAASVAASVALGGLALGTLRSFNRTGDDLLEAVSDHAVPSALAGSDDTRPVVVTDSFAVPRLDWRRWDERRWVLLGSDDAPVVGPDPQLLALIDAGLHRFTAVTSDIESFTTALPEGVEVTEHVARVGRLSLYVVEVR